MKPLQGFRRGVITVTVLVMLCVSFIQSAVNPTRLDFFDKSNNHLMYILFHYNAAQTLIGKTLYMADGTFMRDIVSVPGTDGKRAFDISKNFNTPLPFDGGDTMFVTGYKYGAVTSFTIQDQFKMDQVGGAVNYPNASDNVLEYNLTYQLDNTPAARILYEAAGGNLTKVNVYDAKGSLEYYGTFSTVGITQRSKGVMALSPEALVSLRGAGVAVQLNLAAAATVKCELLTLSGRVAGVVLNEVVPKGNYLKTFHSGSSLRVANGVYLFVVSVNGNVVTSSRYLHQVAGGVR